MATPLQFNPEDTGGDPETEHQKDRDEKRNEDVRSRQREGQNDRQALSHPHRKRRNPGYIALPPVECGFAGLAACQAEDAPEVPTLIVSPTDAARK